MPLSANIKSYWLLLKDLSPDEKISLIELLAQSLKGATNKKQPSKLPKTSGDADWVNNFYGVWSDVPETAEELIQKIEGARGSGRPVEAL